MTAMDNISFGEMGQPVKRAVFAWSAIYLLIFFYRCGMSVFGELFFVVLTDVGDTQSYQNASLSLALEHMRSQFSLGVGMSIWATGFTEFWGAIFGIIAAKQPLGISLLFQSMAFVGIVAFLTSLEVRERMMMTIVILFPTFTIWTSIASKEAVLICALGFVLRQMADVAYGRKDWPTYWILPFLFVVYAYKFQLFLALVSVFFVLMLVDKVKQKTPMVFGFFVLGVIAIYLGWDIYANAVYGTLNNLLSDALEANPNVRFHDMIQGPDDVLQATLTGMAVFLTGPTVEEAASKPTHMVAFMESIVLLGLIFLNFVASFRNMAFMNFIIATFGMFLVMFLAYPTSFYNAGTAVRYRANYLPYIAFLMLVIASSRVMLVRNTRIRVRAFERYLKNRSSKKDSMDEQ